MSNIQNDKETDDIKPLADNKYKDSIVKFMEECDTPFSLALSGKWGSGKTSMMKAIQKEVSTDKNTTIWFNPWENEQHPEPIVPLLQAIMKEISTIHKIKEQSLKMADVIIKSALDTFKSIIDITTAQQHGEKYEYDNFQYIHRQDKLNTMFEQAVKMVLCVKDEIKIDTVLKPNDNSKLIIFIDDLDRCEDSTIIKLLSSIKHHLFTEHCIFIFGYDRFHIEKSISKSTNKTLKESKIYLEKIFLQVFYLKPPTKDQIVDFLKNNLNYNEVADYISTFMSHNPREIKYFIRAFNFNENANKSADIKGIALITYLKIFYENVYALLLNKNEAIEDLKIVFREQNIEEYANHTQHFFYLELHSFINPVDIKPESIDDSDFLNSVYSMQGKHMQFQDYTTKFNDFFNEANNNIEDYL